MPETVKLDQRIQTKPVDPEDAEFKSWKEGREAGDPVTEVDTPAAEGERRGLSYLHAYYNSRPNVDWNTCGQAAIATIADHHGLDPYHLPRTVHDGQDGGDHWDDGQAIDAIKNDGLGPDVVFGFGTTGGRIVDALKKYGMKATLNYSGAASAGWEQICGNLQSWLGAGYPVPVLVDLGALGGQWYTYHWPIAYALEDDGSVVLAAMDGGPRSVDQGTFLSAWHAQHLPYGFNHCSVYAQR